MTTTCIRLIVCALFLGQELSMGGYPQKQTDQVAKDPFSQRVDVVELKAETIFDAIGRLNQAFDVAISIEGILPEKGTTTNPRFTGRMENRTLAETLTWLCVLDNRYTWARDGNVANLFPRGVQNDATYLFNRQLPLLRFEDISQVSEATMQVVHQLPGQPQQLVYWGVGGNQVFAKPWSATFSHLSVRQALNRIAQQMGPTNGWQVGGLAATPTIVFHYKLGANGGYDATR
jgi:hypothetical protein